MNARRSAKRLTWAAMTTAAADAHHPCRPGAVTDDPRPRRGGDCDHGPEPGGRRRAREAWVEPPDGEEPDRQAGERDSRAHWQQGGGRKACHPGEHCSDERTGGEATPAVAAPEAITGEHGQGTDDTDGRRRSGRQHASDQRAGHDDERAPAPSTRGQHRGSRRERGASERAY
jgi:hypothetical protein